MSGIGETQLDELISSIYDGALYPERWQDFLRKLLRGFDVGGDAALLVAHSDGPPWSSTTVDSSFMASYDQHFHAIDPGWKLLPREGTCTTIVGQEALGTIRLDRDPFMNDWLFPQGIRDGINAVIDILPNDQLSRLAFLKPKSSGSVDTVELEVIDRLIPHLRRAFEIHRRVHSGHLDRAPSSRLLDVTRHAVFVLDDRARVVQMNGAAETMIFGEQPDLRVVRQRLRCRRTDDSRRLDALVAQALDAGLGRGPAGLCYMDLHRPPPLKSLAVCILPMRPEVGPESPTSPAVLVCVTNPRVGKVPSEAAIQSVFGLTAAEARVATLLCRGLSVNQAAAQCHKSVHTIKNQLKAIFAKTGSDSQASLVSLILRWIPLMSEPD